MLRCTEVHSYLRAPRPGLAMLRGSVRGDKELLLLVMIANQILILSLELVYIALELGGGRDLGLILL